MHVVPEMDISVSSTVVNLQRWMATPHEWKIMYVVRINMLCVGTELALQDVNELRGGVI